MEPHEREMLDRVLELSEQNNKMLKKMERMARWSTIFRIIYWSVIIGTAIGLFYFMQPYIDEAKEAYGSVRNAIESFATMAAPPQR